MRGPEVGPEVRESPEVLPPPCMLPELIRIKRGEQTGPPQTAMIIEDEETPRGMAALLRCQKCAAATIAFHDPEWTKITHTAEPSFGSIFRNCLAQ